MREPKLIGTGGPRASELRGEPLGLAEDTEITRFAGKNVIRLVLAYRFGPPEIEAFGLLVLLH